MTPRRPNRTETRSCTHPGEPHTHGTIRAYIADKCGCPPCRKAWSRRIKLYRHHVASGTPLTVSPVGVARRLQALAACGWSAVDIARLLDTDKQIVAKWRAGQTHYVMPATARKIAAVYDQVWDQPPPGRYSVKIRNVATRHGWLPPLAWDDSRIDDPNYQPAVLEPDTELDEVAVQRIIDGTLHIGRNSRSLERIEAIRRLAASGNPDATIAHRIGMAPDAVTQARLRNGIPVGVTSTRKKAA